MTGALYRFPRSVQLAAPGCGEPRDDEALSLTEAGGVRVQNRSRYLANPHAGLADVALCVPSSMPALPATTASPDQPRYIVDPTEKLGDFCRTEIVYVPKACELRDRRFSLVALDRAHTGELQPC